MSRLISSVAGLGAGCDADSGTRSSLVFQVLRILKECPIKPQVLICENVPQLCSTENMPNFIKILDMLEDLDYQSKWYLINAKTMGIPQNRNRIFITSVPKGYTTSEPRRMPLEIRLKHLLDKNVDEKYYLSEAMIKYLTKEGTGTYNRKEAFERNLDPNKEVASAILTTSGSRAVDNYIPDDEKMIVGAELDINTYGQCKKAYSTDGLRPTLTTVQGGYQEVKICEKDDFQVIDSYNKRLTDPSLSGTIVTRQGSNQGSMKIDYSTKQINKALEKDKNAEFIDVYNGNPIKDVSTTLTTNSGNLGGCGSVSVIEDSNRGGNSLMIKDATKKGYRIAKDGDGVDISTRMETHRGTVQDGLSLTIKTEMDVGVCVDDDVINPLKDKTDKSWFFEQNVYDSNGCTRALKSTECSGNIPKVIENEKEQTEK